MSKFTNNTGVPLSLAVWLATDTSNWTAEEYKTTHP